MNNRDYLRVLRDFSEQLNNQSYDGNTTAIPTYWTVQEYAPTYDIDPYKADEVLMGFAGSSMLSKVPFKEFKEVISEKISEYFEDTDRVADLQSELEKVKDFDSLINFCEEIGEKCGDYGYWEIEVCGVLNTWQDIANNIFLTKRDAVAFKQEQQVRYPNKKYRTYAYLATDSPDLMNVIKALKNINWDEFFPDEQPSDQTLVLTFKSADDVFEIIAPKNVTEYDVLFWLEKVIKVGVSWSMELMFNEHEAADEKYGLKLRFHSGTDEEFIVRMPKEYTTASLSDKIMSFAIKYFKTDDFEIIS